MQLKPTRIDQGRTPCGVYETTRLVRGGLLRGGRMEEWRECFDGYYEVSSIGRVRRRIANSATKAGRLMKHREDVRSSVPGYPCVNLKGGGCTGRTTYIHSLVAEAFLGPRPDGHQVNHKNGIKNDNRVENLEWVTPSQNRKHAFDTGLQKPTAGSKRHNAKVTEGDVVEMRRRRERGDLLKDIAADYPIKIAMVSEICNRRHWTHVP